MIKFIHFADLHLDGAFAGFPPETAAAKRRETRGLLYKIIDLARSESADFILCAGDLFEGDGVYAETLAAVRDAFAGIDIPVFISPGNHDPYGSASPYAAAEWHENVHIFKTAGFSRYELPELGCAVTGFAYTHAGESGRALEGHRAPDRGLYEILLIHGYISRTGGTYLNFAPEDLAASGYDYAALGHIHTFSEERFGKTLAVMCGSSEGRGFDESGEHGAVVCEVEHGAVRTRLVPLGGSRCTGLRLDITGLSAEAAFEKIVANSAYPPDKTLLKLVLTGRGHFDRDGLSALLGDYSAVRIYDETGDLPQEHAERSGIAGIFARAMLEKINAAENARDAELYSLALDFGLAAIDRGEHPGR